MTEIQQFVKKQVKSGFSRSRWLKKIKTKKNNQSYWNEGLRINDMEGHKENENG